MLPTLRKEEGIDFVIANGENLAAGKGMTYDTYQEMIDVGVDYFTSGNHIWQKREIYPLLDSDSPICDLQTILLLLQAKDL